MRVGLISPKGEFLNKNVELMNLDKVLKERALIGDFWIGLSTALPLIAALTPQPCDIKIIDENIEQIDFSEDFDLVEKENRLLPTGWENYSKSNINFVPVKMTIRELEKGLAGMF